MSQIKAILDTWGKRCDGYLASSNETDVSVSAYNMPRRGKEQFGNIWQKVRATLLAIDRHVADSINNNDISHINNTDTIGKIYDTGTNAFDWFFISGDDTYLLVDSLRAYLQTPEIVESGKGNTPLFLGQVFFVLVYLFLVSVFVL